MFEQMFNGLKSEFQAWLESSVKQAVSGIEERFKIPEPDGPLQLIRSFNIADKPLTQGCVFVDQDSWRIEAYDDGRERTTDLFFERVGGRIVKLFEVAEPGSQECLLVCRAQIKTVDVKEEAKLLLTFERQAEILAIKGCNFTSSQAAVVSGTTDWRVYEVRYHFKKEQYPGLIKINIEFKSSGILWIKDVELLQAPVKAAV